MVRAIGAITLLEKSTTRTGDGYFIAIVILLLNTSIALFKTFFSPTVPV